MTDQSHAVKSITRNITSSIDDLIDEENQDFIDIKDLELHDIDCVDYFNKPHRLMLFSESFGFRKLESDTDEKQDLIAMLYDVDTP